MNNKQRENNLDLLRIIAAIMVIIQHVVAVYLFRTDNNLKGYFTVANIFMSISVFAVPLFVMLSGGFLLSDYRNKKYKTFYKKTYRRIIIPTISWSIIYFIYRILKVIKAYGIHNKQELLKPLIDWVNGQPYNHLWYLYMIIGLYIITPILIRIKEDISKKLFLNIGIILCLVGVIVRHTCELYWILWFVEYVGYFILGYSLKYYSKRVSYKSCIIATVISIMMIFILTEILTKFDYENNMNFYKNLSIFNIVGSISIYMLFNKININRSYKKISESTFNIYLIHQGVIDILYIGISKFTDIKFNPIWYVPLMTIITFIISSSISIFIDKNLSFKSNKENFKNENSIFS